VVTLKVYIFKTTFQWSTILRFLQKQTIFNGEFKLTFPLLKIKIAAELETAFFSS